MTQKADSPPDLVEASKAQQVAAGGPDPDTTRGDTGPGSRPRPGGEAGTPSQGAAAGKGAKYVVLHNMVGAHEQGQVVAESQFPQGTDFGRLERIGAVRVAEGDEHRMDKVTVLNAARPGQEGTFEQLLADKNKQIQQLVAEKSELQTKEAARVAQAASEDANRQSASITTLIAEKDKRIAELERRNRELEMQAGQAGQGGQAGGQSGGQQSEGSQGGESPARGHAGHHGRGK